MNKSEKFTLAGGAGQWKAYSISPRTRRAASRWWPIPHPLYGGTMDNKVAVTLMRTFVNLGYVVARINFRGVGASAGVHDHGHRRNRRHGHAAPMDGKISGLPVALAGFSFGTFVQSHLAQRLAAAGTPAERLVLVGAAAKKWEMAAIPADTILIHGENDDTIPLIDVLDWLRPQDIPVIVIPGADHFFHRKLQHIKGWVAQLWHRTTDVDETETDTASND
jgi:alpha/beta superfamily hydrolase